MIVIFTDQNPQGGRWTSNVANFSNFGEVVVQVQGGSTLYVATDAQQLAQDMGSYRQGLQITQDMGIQRLTWKGAMWISGSGPGQADFQFLGS